MAAKIETFFFNIQNLVEGPGGFKVIFPPQFPSICQWNYQYELHSLSSKLIVMMKKFIVKQVK